ncbi:hypothetical protein EV361DRAFT_959110 [Lentinula raphanica]|nr:hypothetical protein EV361DRAFT_959110 [Lentinula raphanica]
MSTRRSRTPSNESSHSLSPGIHPTHPRSNRPLHDRGDSSPGPEPRGRSRERDRRTTQSSPPARQIHSSTGRTQPSSRSTRETQPSSHSTRETQPSSHSTRETQLNALERIKDLERQLATARSSRENENRKRKAPSEPLNGETPLSRRGWTIPKLVTVYEDIHTLLAQYDEYREKRYHRAEANDDEDDGDVDEEQRAKEVAEKRTLQRGYTGILTIKKSIYPEFLQKIKEAEGDYVVRELEKGAKSARSFDTSKVMGFVGEELNKEVRRMNQTRLVEFRAKSRAQTDVTSDTSQAATSGTEPPPVLTLLDEFRTNTRDNRGLQNDITGRLLCPVEFDWDDPVVRAAVRAFSSEYDFAISARPRCLYKDEIFDSNDPDNGYLQSYLLVQVYRLIFTSPSSTKDQPEDVENLPASSKKKKTGASYRGNVAQIIHMNEVKPRSIAYAAIHLHFALTDAPYWNPGYHGFNYLDLWNFIVDFFEDPGDDEEEKRSKELLEWWNNRIFEGTRSAANSRGTKMISRKQDSAKHSRRSAALHNVSTNGATN